MAVTEKVDILATARELSQRFGEGASERDRERRFPSEELEELKRSGLTLLFVPREAGGLGGGAGDFIRIAVILARGDPNIAQMYLVHSFFSRHVVTLASGAAREKWLRRLVEERLFLANAFTEIGTKTIFDYATTIRPGRNGGWLLSGKKFYCTGSLAADMIAVLCRPVGEELAVIAVVEATAPGVTIHDDWYGMGQRTTASGTVEFQDVYVDADSCFGSEVYETPESVFGLMAQSGFGAIYTGIAGAALDVGVAWAREKTRPWPQSGVERASEDPYILLRVGELSTLVSSAEATLERAASAMDELEAAPSAEARTRAAVAVAEAKAHATAVSLQVTQGIFQVAGASATLEKHNLNRFWRDVRTLTIHDPVDYKYRLVGDYLLNGTPPPVTPFS